MPSSDTYTPEQKTQLLDMAAASIDYGLINHMILQPQPNEYLDNLRQIRATFVTLDINHALRGCIGTLEASRPLIVDVAHNAYAAAFNDPRFPALTAAERDRLRIHISVLTPPVPLPVSTEQDLLDKLTPGIDGLILQDPQHRSTFLPSVWESLPNPRDFLAHLKLKAGLSANYWSTDLRFQRYQTIVIE